MTKYYIYKGIWPGDKWRVAYRVPELIDKESGMVLSERHMLKPQRFDTQAEAETLLSDLQSADEHG